MHPLYVDVSDEVTTVIERLRAAPSTEISLVVPKGAVLLQSIVNLKLVRKAAREAGKEITLITTDRIGRNLAAQVGIANLTHLDQPPEHQAEESSEVIGGVTVHRYYEEEDEPEGVLDIASSDSVAVEPIIPIPPPPADDELEEEDPIAPITVRSFATPAASSGSVEVIKPTSSVTTQNTPGLAAPELMPAKKRRLFIPILLSLLVLLLVGGGLTSAYYFPKTEVMIHVPGKPWNQTYTGQAEVGHAPGGNYLTSARFISATQTDTLTFQATGTKDIGTVAHGTALLSYIQDSNPQTIPAGTTLTANGVTFTTDQDVTVPGAKVVNATPTAGTASVSITATQAGTSSNMSGVPATVGGLKLYAQITQTTGGTTQSVAVVTQSDIQTAMQQIQGKLQDELRTKIEQDPANHPPVSDTSKTDIFTETAISSTPDPNTQATSGSISATGSLKRLVYDPSILLSTVTKLASSNPENPVGITVSSTITGVDLGLGSITFLNQVEGKTIPAVDTQLISNQITGKSPSNAASLIQGIVSGASVTISQQPTWWPIKRIALSHKYLTIQILP